ncbi:hypothetical protein JCM17846_06040 [Iodidimonas nitroreducens]|uniref:Colicin V production protein n=1 Tax=Iodidimonas nitroreducens TaxID=1236968 RepID=A0A5A7N3R8_9PROT|nr:CvpA family protein [Iodidimonas nitroreducens]GAK33761.1 hypothetical protein AQ1_01652 [alpha proteobacterium Q-1]GER02922.1 hypothetical protein JCM17846_06040 [Iodidimonas nitroreducens]
MSESMTAFDILVLIVMAGFFLYAIFRGFTTMLLSVLAWIGAILITLYAMPMVSRFARDLIEPPTLADFIALPVLFIASLVILKIVANFIGGRVRSGPVGFLDRSLGAALGLILGAILISSTYLFFSATLGEKRYPDWVQQARFKPIVAYGATMVAKTGPEIFRTVEQDRTGEALLQQMRKSYDSGSQRLRDVVEPAYEDAQRQMMNQKLEELLKSQDDTPNSKPEPKKP